MIDSLPLIFVAVVAVVLGVLSIKHWHRAILGVFVLLIFEGALRKWAFPSAQAQVYLLKDIILLAAYVGFVLDKRMPDIKIPGLSAIKVIFSIALTYGVLELANPNSPSILVGLNGLKAHFLYIPLAFVMPFVFSSREQFLSLVRKYLMIAVPVAVLGFVQLAAGPDSFLSIYVGSSEDATMLASFGKENELIRTSGTFSYISGYTAYLSFIGFLALGVIFSRGWQLKLAALPMITLILTIGAMFTTGSRSPVYLLLASLPIILWLSARHGILDSRTVLRIGLAVPVIAIASLSISSRAFDAFIDRAMDAGTDSTLDRIIEPFSQTFDAVANAPILGMGIGSTHPASLTILATRSAWWLGDLLTEVETARIAVETGVLGLFLTLLLRVWVSIYAFKCAFSLKSVEFRAIGIVMAVHLLIGMTGSIMLNATAGLYYWGALGLVIAMKRLELKHVVMARGNAADRRMPSEGFATQSARI